MHICNNVGTSKPVAISHIDSCVQYVMPATDNNYVTDLCNYHTPHFVIRVLLLLECSV